MCVEEVILHFCANMLRETGTCPTSLTLEDPAFDKLVSELPQNLLYFDPDSQGIFSGDQILLQTAVGPTLIKRAY